MLTRRFPLLATILVGCVSLAGCTSFIGGPGDGLGDDGDSKADSKYGDKDSDGDGISDAWEGREEGFDTDGDGTPDYLDSDSDGDCILDALEAGAGTPPRDTDADGVHDARDQDSDGDGLPDKDEDLNCNGELDAAETSALEQDTDGDGASDLVESAAATNGRDPGDNPQANGDFVFVVPYEQDPSPKEDDLDFETALKLVDLYVLVDRSGSMSDEINSIKNNMDQVIRNLTCAPAGTGQPGQCIQDLWSGLGSFTYAGRNPYVHHIDIQSDPSLIKTSMPGADTGQCPYDAWGCSEPHLLAAFSALTGEGSGAGACYGTAPYSARYDCSNSPAGSGGIGYPCFRPNALPVVLLATDEPPSTQYSCPGIPGVAGKAYEIGAKIIGIYGDGGGNDTTRDLQQLAGATGAIDSAGNSLVFKGYNSEAPDAIENAVRALTNNVPLDISGVPADDPSDDVDAVEAFVDHVETLQLGSAECADGLTDADSNGDGFPDVFTAVVAGTPLCWRVVPKTNRTVKGDGRPVLYRATLDVYGDDTTLLDQRNVFFVVPPTLAAVE